MFDLNLVKPFLAVYKLQSVTRAAESLDQTQPAVSAALRRFEAVVGYPLFKRAGRSVTPTSMAHTLASQLSEAVELMEGAVYRERELTLYAPANVLYLLPELEGVKIVESPSCVNDILEDIRLNRVDLVIDTSMPKESGFVFEHAMTDRLVFMSDPEFSNFSEQLNHDEYYQAEHVTLRMLRQNVQLVDLLTDHSDVRKVAIEVRSAMNLILNTKGKPYLAALPESMTPIALNMGLKIHQAPFEIKHVDFDFVYHRKHASNAAHSNLINKIKAVLASKNQS